MRKDEYLNRLEWLLQDIPESDREEALSYYRDYFEDAGEENEEAVIEALGIPEKLAAIIREDVKGQSPDVGEFTDTGTRTQDTGKIPAFPIHTASRRPQAEMPAPLRTGPMRAVVRKAEKKTGGEGAGRAKKEAGGAAARKTDNGTGRGAGKKMGRTADGEITGEIAPMSREGAEEVQAVSPCSS